MKQDDIEDIYPLSPMQQGILYHSITDPELALYWVQYTCRLRGRLNVAAFKQAWRETVDLDPVLRTGFIWKDRKSPLQVVLKGVELPWEELDWRGSSAAEQEARFEEFLEGDQRKALELFPPPLMRFALIREAEDGFRFVWGYHHLLLDGWSVPLVLKDVFSLYAGRREGLDAILTPHRPYRDFILWLQSQSLSEAEAYWRKRLEGFAAVTPLGGDRSTGGPPGQRPEFKESRIGFSRELTTALQSMSRRHHVTVNTLLQGAWALLLSRYSRESDVVFGATVSGRPVELAGIESMTGLFINTLPVRAIIHPDDSLGLWLEGLQRQFADMQKYEHSPLAQVQAWSDVPRPLPLFESIFVFENYPGDDGLGKRPGNLEISDVRFLGRTNYPITVEAALDAELRLRISYDKHRFDDAAVGRMLGHYRTILEGIVAGPHQRLRDIPLLTGPERHQLLVEWNPAIAAYPRDNCIHQLFEAQAARTPEAVALLFEGKPLTYRELNQKSNRLAHYLRNLGIGPDVLVGLYMERSSDLVVALLAILKAGGAYLPLDTVYPPDRLAFMLDDAEAPIVVSTSALASRLGGHRTRVLCLDDPLLMEALGVAGWTENPVSDVTPENLIYVIYTSGTTGNPKGTSVTHQNVARLLAATRNWYCFDEKDVWTLFHSHAFDVSVWEIWGSLLYGGRLVVVPYLVSRSPDSFYELLIQERVTVLNQTPSAFRQLIQAEGAAPRSARLSLRLVICAGEALEMRSLKPWFDRHGDQHPQLVNMYGITETTVHVTYRPLKASDIHSGSMIGIPIPDLQVYILDPNQEPAPIGIPGEIFVGGAGLARGYLKRPELTAAKFIPNLFSDAPGARLYRTGDLARFLPNRDIEYLGRIDHQIKIRGFRVELGEIESVLGQHPSLREVLVMAREDGGAEKRLVAYIVPNQTTAFSVDELRRFLKEKLPDYMVPSAFVPMPQFPLTAHGKVDRRALPAPDPARSSPSPWITPSLNYVPPQTGMEQAIADLWRTMIGVERVGVEENFFDLGGHSLLLVQMHGRLQEILKTDFPIVTLFEHPTIRSLARHLGDPDRPAFQAGEDSRDRAQRQKKALDQLRSRKNKRDA